MNEKNIDLEQFLQELEDCGELPLQLNSHQAYVCACLLQLALKHPDLNPEETTYQTGRAIAQMIHANLAKLSPLVGEVLDKGWDGSFMVDIEFPQEEELSIDFSDLSPGKRYQTALLYTALGMATSWLDEVTDQSLEEINKVVFQLAECNLADNDYEAVPEIIDKIDNGKVID